jgi:hypothetical protein
MSLYNEDYDDYYCYDDDYDLDYDIGYEEGYWRGHDDACRSYYFTCDDPDCNMCYPWEMQ